MENRVIIREHYGDRRYYVTVRYSLDHLLSMNLFRIDGWGSKVIDIFSHVEGFYYYSQQNFNLDRSHFTTIK